MGLIVRRGSAWRRSTDGAGERDPRRGVGCGVAPRDALRGSGGDGSVAHDHVAPQQAGHLPRRDPVERLAELQLEPRPLPHDPARHRARVVAQPHGVDLGARPVQPRAAHGHAIDARARRACRPRRASPSVRSTYSGSAAATPSPLRCPTVKWCAPRCAPTTSPERRTISPGASSSPPWRARNRAFPTPARKHRSCESAREATGSPASQGQRTHLGLGQLGQREPHPRQRRGRQRREHVGLVLGRIGRRAQQPVLRDPRVVPGGETPKRRARPRTRASRRAARRRCSGCTGSASPPRRSRPGTARPRPPGTPAADQREVRQPHPVRDRPRQPHRVGRAAGRGGVVLDVAPQLQRDRDRVLAHEQRRDRRVHAAAHRDERAPRRRARRPSAQRHPSARCSASAARSAACSLPGESPPSSATIARVPTRAASSSSAPATSVTTAEPGRGQRAAARGVEARPRRRGRRRRGPRRGSGRRRPTRRRRRHAPPESTTPRPLGAARCSSNRSRSTTA